MATPGLLAVVNQLRSEFKTPLAGFKRASGVFPNLDRQVFNKLWRVAGERMRYTDALARVQNPNYRPGIRSLMPSEFKVPFNYRYTFKHTMVHALTGEKKTYYSSVYDDRLLTRGEAEEMGHMMGANMMYSGEYKQAKPDPYWQLLSTRMTLAEVNRGK
jgi:hypothetical protein